MSDAPICPLCKIREREFDSEPPGPGSYFSNCSPCSLLIGYRYHSHTHYPTEVQVKAGTFRAGHSWRTSVAMLPVFEGGAHVGYRCGRSSDRGCDYAEWFTAEEREACPTHTKFPDYPVLKGVCHDFPEHRIERGEIDGRGYLTEFGRAEERRRSDEANRF